MIHIIWRSRNCSYSIAYSIGPTIFIWWTSAVLKFIYSRQRRHQHVLKWLHNINWIILMNHELWTHFDFCNYVTAISYFYLSSILILSCHHNDNESMSVNNFSEKKVIQSLSQMTKENVRSNNHFIYLI